MAQLVCNSFSRYTLTDQEELSGSIFSAEQKYVLQNLLAEYSERKLNLMFDSDNPTIFAQQEAELTGQTHIIRYLIDKSDNAEKELLHKAGIRVASLDPSSDQEELDSTNTGNLF